MFRSIALAALVACGVAACGSTTGQRVGGAAVGAGTGAVVGGPVGAVVGGAAGAIMAPTVVRGVRHATTRRVRRHRYHRPARQS
jgi:osmotically inducible lipoprotein OsmB